MNRIIKNLSILIGIISFIFPQSVTITPCGGENVDGVYNISNSADECTDVNGAGGFTFAFQNFDLATNPNFDILYGWAVNSYTNVALSYGVASSGSFSVHVPQSSFGTGFPSTGQAIKTIYIIVEDLRNRNYYPAAGKSFKIDVDPPSVTTVSITSSNSDDTWAKVDDRITVSIISDEALDTDEFTQTIAGIAASKENTDGGTNKTWNFFTDVTTGHTQGQAAFTIFYKDINGNSGNAVTAITTGSNVSVDYTAPSIDAGFPTFTSNNNVNYMAKADNVATLTMTFGEILKGKPTVAIGGNTTNVTVTPNEPALTYVATKTLATGTANDASYDPDQVAVTISNIEDRAGNPAAANITNANFSNYIVFDETAPTQLAGGNTFVITEAVNFDNDADTKYAKDGETVTLVFKTSEPLGDATGVGWDNVIAMIGGLQGTVTGGGTGKLQEYTITRELNSTVANGALAITVNYTDIAGNPGNQITQGDLDGGNVTFDKSGPTITVTNIQSNNGTNSLAKTGNIVTVSISSNEPLFSIPFGTATVGTTVGGTYTGNAFSDGNLINPTDAANPSPGRETWTIKYTMAGTEQEGPVNFEFIAFDYAGNSTTNLYTDGPNDGSAVTFDKTLQALTLVNIISDNTDPAMAKQGDEIKLTVESPEQLAAAPTVQIAGNTVAASVVNAGLKWEYTHDMALADNEGVVSTSIIYSDLAGNSNGDGDATNDSYNDGAYTARTDLTSVTYDRTKPYFSIDANCADCAVTMASIDNVSNTHATQGDRVRLTLVPSENLKDGSVSVTMASNLVTDDAGNTTSGSGDAATVDGANRSWTATHTLDQNDTEGSIFFTITATDLAGNSLAATRTGLTSGDRIVYDRTPPTATPTLILSSNNPNNSGATQYAILDNTVSLSITATDPILEPTVTIAGTVVDLVDAAAKANWDANYTVAADATADADGKIQYQLTLKDQAYNETQIALTNVGSDGSEVLLDLVKPNVTDDGTYINIYSNNDNTELASPGDKITLKMKFSETLGSDPIVKILNRTIADVTGPDAGVYTAELTVSTNEDDNGGAGTIINNATSNSAILSITQIKDAAGNQSNPTEITATTTGTVTFDKTAPQFAAGNGVVMTSDANDYDDTDQIIYAKQGDKVIITITADEAILDPNASTNISMMGATADINCTAIDGVNAFQCEKELTAGHSAGAVAFSVLINDLAGNQSAVTKSAVETGGNVVHYDKTAPSVNTISFTSPNNTSSSAYAVPGNMMLLTFVTDEKIQDPTVTIAGAEAIVSNAATDGTPATDKKTWRATYTLTGDETFDTSTNPARVPFSITFSNYADISGTEETHTRYTGIHGGDAVEYDSDAPALTVTSFQNTENSDGEAVISPLFARAGSKVTLLINSTEDLDVNTITATVCGLDETAATNPPIVTLINNNRTIKVTKVLGTQAAEIASLDADGFIDFSIFARNTFGFAIAENITKDDITGSSVKYDRTNPSINDFSISSSGGQAMVGGKLYAKKDDVVTVTVTADEDLDTPSILIGDQAVGGEITVANVDGNAKQWTATYKMGSAAAGTDQDGTISVAMTYTDLAGNSGTVKSQTDLANLMVYDKVAPSFEINNATTVVISSNNTGSNSSIQAGSRAKIGDNLSLLFKITDVGGIPGSDDENFTVSIGGVTEQVTLSDPAVDGNTTTYTASFNSIPDISAGVEAGGDINFSIAISDYAGNSALYGDDTLAADGGANVIFDNTVPTIGTLTIVSSTAKYNNTDYAKVGDQVTLSFTVTENDAILTGKPILKIAGDLCSNAAGGNTQVMSLSNDQNGNGEWDTGDSFSATYVLQNSDQECADNNDRLKFSVYVDDIAGNRSVVKTAVDTDDGTYVVFDKTNPTVNTNILDGCKIFCNTASTLSAKHIKAGTLASPETFQLQITFEEVVKQPTILFDFEPTDKSPNTISTVDNQTFLATLSLDTDDVIPTSNNDTIFFTVNFEDYAGNAGVQHSTTTDQSYVVFDKTAPSLTTLSISSNNSWDDLYDINHPKSPNNYAKTGDQVVVTVTADEALHGGDGVSNGVVAKIKTANATFTPVDLVASSNNDKTWSNTYLMQPGNLEGVIDFTLTITDSAGNVLQGLTNANINNGTSIQYDETLPPMTGVSISLSSGSDTGIDNSDLLTNLSSPKFDLSGLTVGDSVYIIASNDTLYRNVVGVGRTSLTDLSLTSTLAHNITPGYEVKVSQRDPAGNLSAPGSDPTLTLLVDLVAPNPGSAPNLIDNDDSGWSSTDDVTKTAQPSFEITGLTTVLDSIDLYVEGVNPVSAPVIVSKERMTNQYTHTMQVDDAIVAGGRYNVYYKLNDNAGNTSSGSDTLSVKFDFIAPQQPGQPDLLQNTDLGEASDDDKTDTNKVAIKIDYKEPNTRGYLYRVRVDNTPVDTTLVLGTYSVSGDLIVGLDGTKTYNLEDEVTDGDSSRYVYYPVIIDSAGNSTDGPDLTMWYDFKDPSGIITYSDPDDTVYAGNSSTVASLSFNEPLSISPRPTITLVYPENGGTVGPVNLVNDDNGVNKKWRYTINLDNPAYQEVDGYMIVNIDADDVAGNPVTPVHLANDSLLFDNTNPKFRNIYPSDSSYVNSLDKFHWFLTDMPMNSGLQSGIVYFDNQTIPSVPDIQISLTGTELTNINFITDSAAFINGDPQLVDGHLYNITFQGVDIAGNVGADTVYSVRYDTTMPSATLNYSRLFASKDTTVVCSAKFNEPMLSSPFISLDYGGTLSNDDDLDSIPMQATNDPSVWVYNATMPAGISNQGIVKPAIFARDLAKNILDTLIVGSSDSLFLDNTVATATLSYTNETQDTMLVYYPNALPDTIRNVGVGGDTIHISVKMNEPLLTDPKPTLTLKYDAGAGDVVTVTDPIISNNDSTLLFNNIVLLDNERNDGYLKILLNAKDRSTNIVSFYSGKTDSIFIVDNKHPAPFNLSEIRLSSVNPALVVDWQDLSNSWEDMDNDPNNHWYNKRVSHFYVNVPLPPYDSPGLTDTTMWGGMVDIQFKNLRGPIDGKEWVTIGPSDTLDPNVDFDSTMFFRDTAAVNAAIMPYNGFILGDSLLVRAIQTDRHGNKTISNLGDGGVHKFFYDRTQMNIGSLVNGNIFLEDTLFSTDTISAQWSEFLDPGGSGASGFWKYTFSVARHNVFQGDTTSDTTMRGYYNGQLWENWVEVQTPENIAQLVFNSSDVDTLSHNTMYEFLIFAQDLAGNMSDTLSSGKKFKKNSKPVISSIEPWVMQEDSAYTDFQRIITSDIDSLTFQGDIIKWTVKTIKDGSLYADHPIEIEGNKMSWSPLQEDVGNYTVRVVAEDLSNLKDSTEFALEVIAVNDAPVLKFVDDMGFLINPDSVFVFSFEEDVQTNPILNLTKYVSDVDNNDSTEITWQAVILDTNQLGSPYPMGRVIVGPGTSIKQRVRLMKEFMGINPAESLNFSNKTSLSRKKRKNNILNIKSPSFNDHPIEIRLADTLGNGTMQAVFDSDSNYYGNNHRVIFIVQDPFVPGDPYSELEARDTIMISVLEQNDPPILQSIDDREILENDSLVIDFGSYTTDVDDSALTFLVKALTNPEFMSITPDSFLSQTRGDSVIIKPQSLWSQNAQIQVIAMDEADSDTSTFMLDVIRVKRPAPSVSIIQNNVFANYLDIVVVDTVEKTTDISFEIQSEPLILNQVAPYTWTTNFNFGVEKSYSFEIRAEAVVGDTLWGNAFTLALAKPASRWLGSSSDGSFTVSGSQGSVKSDQPLLIVDSTMFSRSFYDDASYVVGNENIYFDQPVRVSLASRDQERALYTRQSGRWVELPSVSTETMVVAYSGRGGYYRLGPKTIIVPDVTNLHQNYPNPFNPVTNIRYDVGLLDGLKQNVSISVYNLLGQKVRTLVENKDQIGHFTIQWNGENDFGKEMPTGMYFVQLTTSTGMIKNSKMMLLK